MGGAANNKNMAQDHVLEVGDGERSPRIKKNQTISLLRRRTSPMNFDDVGAIGEKMMQHHV
jgi:hypothetical protein